MESDESVTRSKISWLGWVLVIVSLGLLAYSISMGRDASVREHQLNARFEELRSGEERVRSADVQLKSLREAQQRAQLAVAGMGPQLAELASLRKLMGTATLHMVEVRGTELAPMVRGRLLVDPASGEGMIGMRGVPALQPGEHYACWFFRLDESAVYAGAIQGTGDGLWIGEVAAPSNLERVVGAGLSIEQSERPEQPSQRMLATGEISR